MRKDAHRFVWILISLLWPLIVTGCLDDDTDDDPTPSIASLSPAIGVPGESVVLTGTDLGAEAETRQVLFTNGVAVIDVTQWTEDQIAFTIPDGATAGCVQVTVGDEASNCAQFEPFAGQCETWESGSVDNETWQAFGATPSEVDTPDADDDQAFGVNGDETCGAGVVSQAAYLTDQYLLAAFSLKGETVENPTCMTLRAGFTGKLADDTDCTSDEDGYYEEIAWITLDLASEEKKIRYETISGDSFEETYPDDAWHSYGILINADATVSFLRDGILRFTGKNAIDTATYPSTRFQVWGQACDGQIWVDDACIDGVVADDADGWTDKEPMPTARKGAIAAVVEKTIFVIGGVSGDSVLTTVERYDTRADTWSTAFSTSVSWAEMPVAVSDAASVVLDGKIYLIGGAIDGVSSTGAYFFDPSENTWTAIADLPEARHDAAAVVVDGYIYVFGGRSTDSAGTSALHVTVFRYDPETDAWTSLPDLPGPRAAHGAALLSEVAYLVSGVTCNASGAEKRTNSILKAEDPESGTYTEMAPIALAGLHYGCAGAEGVLVSANGHISEKPGDGEVFSYDAETDLWSRLPSDDERRYRSATVQVGKTLYMIGGADESGAALSDVAALVLPINSAPVAQDQSVQTTQDTAVTFTLAATDADNDTLSYTLVDEPQNGTISGTAPALTYTPADEFTGTDTLTFTANDGTIDSEVATVTFTVSELDDENTPPVIDQGDSVAVTMSEDGSPTAFSVTLSATDTDNDTLSWRLSSPAENGTASVSGTGASALVSYVPQTNYVGSDTFVAEVGDGNGGTDTVTVTIDITAVNDPPVISGEPATTGVAGEIYTFTPSASDPDDGDDLTFSVINLPDWADAFDAATGTVSGTPDDDDIGTFSNITLTVTDSDNASDTLSPFSITVSP